jgi:hypothetical protein
MLSVDHCGGAVSGGAKRGETGCFAALERQIPRMTHDQGPLDGHRVPPAASMIIRVEGPSYCPVCQGQ